VSPLTLTKTYLKMWLGKFSVYFGALYMLCQYCVKRCGRDYAVFIFNQGAAL